MAQDKNKVKIGSILQDCFTTYVGKLESRYWVVAGFESDRYYGRRVLVLRSIEGADKGHIGESYFQHSMAWKLVSE